MLLPLLEAMQEADLAGLASLASRILESIPRLAIHAAQHADCYLDLF